MLSAAIQSSLLDGIRHGGSTNLLGGVIVPGVNPNSSSNHHHSTHLHHHDHHLHQQPQPSTERTEHHLQQEQSGERQHSQQTVEQKQALGSFSSTPSPHHHQQPPPPPHSAQSPPIHYTHSHFGHQQHPLSMLPTHHLHSHHDLSPSGHHHQHLSRAPSPLEHHHLLQHRRSSLSPSPTGRSSNSTSAAGILSSARSSELSGPNRLLLPLPLNACHRCDVCGKLLSTKLTLKRHKEQQHLQPLNNAVCNLCHKVFRTLNSLNNHKSIYHRRQKHHSYFHHSNISSGVGAPSSAGSRLHQSLSSLSAAAAANTNVNANSNGNAVAAAAAAAAAAAELLLSGPTMQLSSHPQSQSSPNMHNLLQQLFGFAINPTTTVPNLNHHHSPHTHHPSLPPIPPNEAMAPLNPPPTVDLTQMDNYVMGACDDEPSYTRINLNDH
ncbi:hypothetical protein GQX74_010013 [Glossina fuscipes]|nr:hypothetical protein GQX74_010013 [Glossina fuscipes]